MRSGGHWLKAIGHARGPLAEDWPATRPELLRRTGCPRRPRIEPGDRLVSYASVWRRVFAVVEAIGVAARSMSRHSHIRITAEHYERAHAALASIAR